MAGKILKAAPAKIARVAPAKAPVAKALAAKAFVPYYGGKGGKMSSGAGWGGEKSSKKK